MDAKSFTVCLLFYGDYPDMAQRCLAPLAGYMSECVTGSVEPQRWITSLRIGLNAVSDHVRRRIVQLLRPVEVYFPGRILLYDSPFNRGKYPLMRKMFHDQQHPLVSDSLMWFDDDSRAVKPDSDWWKFVHRLLHTGSNGVLGHVWTRRWSDGQLIAIRNQPWYAGKHMEPRCRFVTGGWWAGRTELIRRWDYPFPALHHNGGDTLLSELCRQQGYAVGTFIDGLEINAGDKGVSGSAPRRGLSQPPLWQNYSGGPDRLDQHNFVLHGSVLEGES